VNRGELVRRMVLNTMCDDYENIDQIVLPTVARDCAKLGIIVERPEIVSTVSRLLEDGLIKAYDLQAGDELDGMPSVDLIEFENTLRTYFYVTGEGLEYHRSDKTWWPFDDDDVPVPGWHLDEEPDAASQH